MVNLYVQGDPYALFHHFHSILDRHKVFQYFRSSCWSRESLDLALKDKSLPNEYIHSSKYYKNCTVKPTRRKGRKEYEPTDIPF